MSMAPLLDDDDQIIPFDHRMRIHDVLRPHGYSANDGVVFELNWILNRAIETWVTDQGERAKASREAAVESLSGVAKAFQDFLAAWGTVTRNLPAKKVMFDAARSISGKNNLLFNVDAVVVDPAIKALMRTLGQKKAHDTIPYASPGVVSFDPIMPCAERILATLRSGLEATGSVPRTRAAATHAKRCQIASEILALGDIVIASSTLQNRTKGF